MFRTCFCGERFLKTNFRISVELLSFSRTSYFCWSFFQTNRLFCQHSYSHVWLSIFNFHFINFSKKSLLIKRIRWFFLLDLSESVSDYFGLERNIEKKYRKKLIFSEVGKNRFLFLQRLTHNSPSSYNSDGSSSGRRFQFCWRPPSSLRGGFLSSSPLSLSLSLSPTHILSLSLYFSLSHTLFLTLSLFHLFSLLFSFTCFSRPQKASMSACKMYAEEWTVSSCEWMWVHVWVWEREREEKCCLRVRKSHHNGILWMCDKQQLSKKQNRATLDFSIWSCCRSVFVW